MSREIADLEANQTDFYYQMYMGEMDVLDEYGDKTGETVISYSDPIHARAMISPNTSEVAETPFGRDLRYDKMISTVQKLPINEYSKLFIDIEPRIVDGTLVNEADYEVVKVAKGLYQNVWAIKRVDGYEYSNQGQSVQSI